MAQKGQYDPWSIPDDFTVYKSSPEWLQPLLHPHWQTQKAVHPFFNYFCGLYLLVGGNLLFLLPCMFCAVLKMCDVFKYRNNRLRWKRDGAENL